MKDKVFLGIQILAGLMLVVFGLNKFLNFIPMPPASAEMSAFMGALFTTGYFMKLVAIVEIVAGLSFITNKFTALMAVVVIPVMVNATLAHLFLDPSGIGGALILTVFTILVMVGHKDAYSKILSSQA
ncbi:MAG: putative oxidoreductase [Sulfurimonas sp.]|jgi:putative oxidoreductase